MRHIVLVSLVLASLIAGCGSMGKGETIGTVGGAAAGGVVGSAVTGGSTVGTIGGAAVGGVVGNHAGEQYDKKHP